MQTSENFIQSEFDGGQGGGGSNWSTVLKVTGIGCAVLLLVGGVLAGFGVFKAATCCSQFADLAMVSQDARELGYDFAEALHEQEYERAYQFLDDETRQRVSLEEFRAEVGEYSELLTASKPYPVIVHMEEDAGGMDTLAQFSRWRLTTRFADPRSERSLELHFQAEYKVDPEDQEVMSRSITDWELSPRTRILEEDPSAQAAKRFYDRIRQERYADAIRLVTLFGPMRDDGEEELEKRLRTIYEETGGERAKVVAVYPHDREMIGVQMLVERSDGTGRTVEVLVTAMNHQVFEVAPVRAADPSLLMRDADEETPSLDEEEPDDESGEDEAEGESEEAGDEEGEGQPDREE